MLPGHEATVDHPRCSAAFRTGPRLLQSESLQHFRRNRQQTGSPGCSYFERQFRLVRYPARLDGIGRPGDQDNLRLVYFLLDTLRKEGAAFDCTIPPDRKTSLSRHATRGSMRSRSSLA